jgi:hypothetical protein
MHNASLVTACLLGCGIAASVAPALAQSAPASVTAQRQPDVRARAVPQSRWSAWRNAGPSFQVLGVPVRAYAPVATPYSGSAYQTFAGQAETGKDVILAQGFNRP